MPEIKKNRNLRVRSVLLGTLLSAVIGSAGAAELSDETKVERVTTSRGTGIVLIHFKDRVPNPAGCGGSGRVLKAAINLNVATPDPDQEDAFTGEDTSAGPRGVRRRPWLELGLTAEEASRRDEVRLMTDNVFLAVVGAYPLRVAIDADSCLGNESQIAEVRAVLVSP